MKKIASSFFIFFFLAKISFSQSISCIDKQISANDFNFTKKISLSYLTTINNPDYNSLGIKFESISSQSSWNKTKLVLGAIENSTHAYYDTVSYRPFKISNPSLLNIYVGFERSKWISRYTKNYFQINLGYFHVIKTIHRPVVGPTNVFNAELYFSRTAKKFTYSIYATYNKLGKYMMVNDRTDGFESDTALKRRFTYNFVGYDCQMGLVYKIINTESLELNVGVEVRFDFFPPIYSNSIYHIVFFKKEKFSIIYSVATKSIWNKYLKTSLFDPVEQRIVASGNLFRNFILNVEAREQGLIGFINSNWNYYELGFGCAYTF